MPGSVEISADELLQLLASDHAPLVIDVREPFERLASFIEPSQHLPMDQLSLGITALAPDKDRDLVLYCSMGQRSAKACENLSLLGYTRVRSLAGGLGAWRGAGAPTRHQASSRGAASARYARQVQMPEVGLAGQQKLLDARVLIVGAGGLGSPAAYYLAAAGVGVLGLVDFDVVDETNLHRQILYKTAQVGASKVYAAKSVLEALNPDIQVVPFPVRLTSENAEQIVRGYDLVLDGADNFAARYLVNDVCLKLNLPNVHGAIHQFEGQVSVFGHSGGPCYRCLFPEPPPPGWVPSCAEAGVLGFLPGIVGTLQAAEAIKLILGKGDVLSGRLLRMDALAMTFETFEVSKRSDCAYCKVGGTFPGLVDYDELCGSG